MIKKLLHTLKKELMNDCDSKSEKNCCDCKYLELIPFDDWRCMNAKSELFHCECNPKEDVCKYFEEKE
jgi:hypothetical protein